MNEEEMNAEEFNAKYAPWTVKKKYVPVFGIPDDPWDVDASWEDAYYRAAKDNVQGVVDGKFMPAIEGVAGVFLFRHYLELALKHLIFHARWLKDADTIAERGEIEDVKNTHNLQYLWDTAMKAIEGKIPKDVLDAYDVEFAKNMVLEFHKVDDKGVRFRYHGDKFGVDKTGAKAPVVNHLYIEYKALLVEMEHTRDVLWALDNYVYEHHGQLQDWEAEMRSW